MNWQRYVATLSTNDVDTCMLLEYETMNEVLGPNRNPTFFAHFLRHFLFYIEIGNTKNPLLLDIARPSEIF